MSPTPLQEHKSSNLIFMNKFFSRLSVAIGMLCGSSAATAQCAIDYDFGDAPWGVSPDPTLGETFDTGMIDEPYEDVLHIKVPLNASVLDENLDLELDSVQVVQDFIDAEDGTYYGVVFVDTATQEQFFADELGLTVTFNNNGSSPVSTTVLPDAQYCAAIDGVPTRAGFYQIKLDVTVWVNPFGAPFPQLFTFDNFTLRVNCPLIEGVDISPVNSVENTQGQLTVTLADGVVAEEIAWYNSSGLFLGNEETVSVDNAGTFTVLVTTEDCVGEFDGWLVIDAGLDCDMTAEVEATGADEGQLNGSATVTVTGAEGEWTATWFNENNLLVGNGATIDNLAAGDYSVLVVDDIGCSAEVSSFTVVSGLASLVMSKWHAYPNPARDVLVLNDSFGTGQWWLMGTDGRAVASGRAQQQTSIDVSDVPEGMYILSVEHNGVSTSKRIAIQR